MNRTRRIATIAAASAALVGAAGATSYAIAGGDDKDAGATGPGADRARAAALDRFRGAKANSVERDGENGATWEVEITRRDGATVDVRLDAAYGLVVVEADGEDRGGR